MSDTNDDLLNVLANLGGTNAAASTPRRPGLPEVGKAKPANMAGVSAPPAPVKARPVHQEPERTSSVPAVSIARPPEEPMEIEATERAKSDSVASVDDMLRWMIAHGGSDLFISANSVPLSEIHGKLQPIEGFGKLSGDMTKRTIYSILSEGQRKKFEENKELDSSYAIPGLSRFRVNVFRSKGNVSSVMRAIPFEIKPIEDLGLPHSLNQYATLPRGLVLVTGPTGSGKSTTLAAIIDQINRTQHGHILTIEDPIEFVHNHKSCIVNQREVGDDGDTNSFQNALKAALREAPKYVLVGEMRDYETIALAITMAETGHLVFGTLHTNSAPETISRIVDVFPADQQDQIRTQLAASLQSVVCQNLVRTADGNGRVAAVEVMNITQSIKSKIIRNQLNAIVSDLQTGSRLGMQTMDSHLERLAREKRITIETAIEKSHRPKEMIEAFGGEEAIASAANTSRRRTVSYE